MESKIVTWIKKPENIVILFILLAAVLLGTIKYSFLAVMTALLAAVLLGLYLKLMVRIFGRRYPVVGILLGLVILVILIDVIRRLFF